MCDKVGRFQLHFHPAALSLFLILLKNKAWRERVAVLAVGAALWTRPEPPVLVVLHRVEKELANLDGKKLLASCVNLFDFN